MSREFCKHRYNSTRLYGATYISVAIPAKISYLTNSLSICKRLILILLADDFRGCTQHLQVLVDFLLPSRILLFTETNADRTIYSPAQNNRRQPCCDLPVCLIASKNLTVICVHYAKIRTNRTYWYRYGVILYYAWVFSASPAVGKKYYIHTADRSGRAV